MALTLVAVVDVEDLWPAIILDDIDDCSVGEWLEIEGEFEQVLIGCRVVRWDAGRNIRHVKRRGEGIDCVQAEAVR